MSIHGAAYRLKLPTQLEARRGFFERTIDAALRSVSAWFAERDMPVAPGALIDTAVVLDDRAMVRTTLARAFGVSPDSVPSDFSGTVKDRTLFLVTPALFGDTWRSLYPDFPWNPEHYQTLAAHEIAHRAHETLALERFGTADAMGPIWFFEGLAVACAGQFEDPREPFAPLAFETLVALTHQTNPGYPAFGRMVRSLLASFPARFLVERAGQEGFPHALADGYCPSMLALEHPRDAAPRASILIVPDGAPADLDGRLPGRPASTEGSRDPLLAGLSAALTARGLGVLRFSRPGIGPAGIDTTAFGQADVSGLARQLKTLFRFLPDGRPRFVLALGEGSLYLGALPLDRLAGLALVGAVSTTLAEVLASASGAGLAQLHRQLAAMPRSRMYDADKPAGRLADELALAPVWSLLEPYPRLPILVLHGTADREVPVSQALAWRQSLPHHTLSVRLGQGLDHRYMRPGHFEPELVASAIAEWVEGVGK